jgi:hypothetical protein
MKENTFSYVKKKSKYNTETTIRWMHDLDRDLVRELARTWLSWSLVILSPHGSTKKRWYFSSVRGPPCIFLVSARHPALPMASAPSRLPLRCRLSSSHLSSLLFSFNCSLCTMAPPFLSITANASHARCWPRSPALGRCWGPEAGFIFA